MSLGNLFVFAVLTTIVAFPIMRKLEVETSQLDTRTANLHKIETSPSVLFPVQSRNPRDLGLGKLLVARRELADPNFAQTVILLVHYNNEGVLGLILNRPTDFPISRVFAQLEAAKGRSDMIYLGGPVGTRTLFGLLQSADKLEGAEHVFGNVNRVSTKTTLEKAISSHPDLAHFMFISVMRDGRPSSS